LKNHIINCGRLTGMVVCALGICSQAAAVDEGYVATVKAEVEEFSSKSFTLTDSPWVPASKAAEEGAELKGTLAEFEEFLRVEAAGTYIFFKRLPDWQKSQLQEEYKKTGDLERLKAAVYQAQKR
jgi:hypothetical protein